MLFVLISPFLFYKPNFANFVVLYFGTVSQIPFWTASYLSLRLTAIVHRHFSTPGGVLFSSLSLGSCASLWTWHGVILVNYGSPNELFIVLSDA